MPAEMSCSVKDPAAQDLLVLLPLAYVVPSLLAYFLVFFAILRYFRSSTFYMLFLANGISVSERRAKGEGCLRRDNPANKVSSHPLIHGVKLKELCPTHEAFKNSRWIRRTEINFLPFFRTYS